MKMFVLVSELPHEGAMVLGVFNDIEIANMAMSKHKEEDTSKGYTEFFIDEFELNKI